jgi:uncharacterized membrane protein YbhN (UPF0104 family)
MSRRLRSAGQASPHAVKRRTSPPRDPLVIKLMVWGLVVSVLMLLIAVVTLIVLLRSSSPSYTVVVQVSAPPTVTTCTPAWPRDLAGAERESGGARRTPTP